MACPHEGGTSPGRRGRGVQRQVPRSGPERSVPRFPREPVPASFLLQARTSSQFPSLQKFNPRIGSGPCRTLPLALAEGFLFLLAHLFTLD